MVHVSLAAVAIAPCLTHAFVPHAMSPRSVAGPMRLAMSSQEHNNSEAMSRGEALSRAAASCVGGGTLWSIAASGVAAKTPVMKLPDDDETKPALNSGSRGTIPPFTVLPSGVQIADIVVGDGVAAAAGKGVVLKWVMRRSNGYYVSSSTEGDGEPFVYRVGDEQRAIKGLDEGIRGMKAGGTRRIVVPPQLAYVEGCKDGKPGPIPVGLGPKQQINTRKAEPLSFEVKLTKVR